jgi:hypothetical protein
VNVLHPYQRLANLLRCVGITAEIPHHLLASVSKTEFETMPSCAALRVDETLPPERFEVLRRQSTLRL